MRPPIVMLADDRSRVVGYPDDPGGGPHAHTLSRHALWGHWNGRRCQNVTPHSDHRDRSYQRSIAIFRVNRRDSPVRIEYRAA